MCFDINWVHPNVKKFQLKINSLWIIVTVQEIPNIILHSQVFRMLAHLPTECTFAHNYLGTLVDVQQTNRFM